MENKLSEIMEMIETLPAPLMVDYGILSGLFQYPEYESHKAKIKHIHAYLLQCHPEAADVMNAFMEYMEVTGIEEMQELYLRSFDVQAITTLDIGFVLFGEDYKRGKLLVHLNQEHARAGNSCGTELSDHLLNLLNLLSKMTDYEMRYEIAVRLIMPAVEKMIAEFSTEKIQKKDAVYKKHLKVLLENSGNYRTIYQTILETLFIALKRDFLYVTENYEDLIKNAGNSDDRSFFGPRQEAPQVHEHDFAHNIESEMLTDK